MRAFARCKLKQGCALLLSVLLAFEPVAYAQYEAATPPPANAPAQRIFSQQELDQMLAPIALYPDPLLSQILMAATYPLEVVEAARWSRANPALTGDSAVRAVEQMDWDPSVKSLVAFPQILQVMDEKLDWTERLGDAFLSQQTQVTDTVQNLRLRAYAAGYLKSSDQIQVVPEGQLIMVEPANPDIIYVPYYDPFVFYGPWWWADYPPIYWAPWPGYYYGAGYATGFLWGFGITVTSGFFFGNFDWHHHRVNVVNVNNYYYGRRVRGGMPPTRHIVNAAPGIWQHDPDHRRGVPYRDPSWRQRFGRAIAPSEERRDYRGFQQPSVGGRTGAASRHIEGGTAPVFTHRPETRSIPGGTPSIPSGTPTIPSGTSAIPGGTYAIPGGTPAIPGGTPSAIPGGSRERHSTEPRPAIESVPQSRPIQPIQRGPQVRPSAPSGLASRPAPERRPPALEDIGRGANVRDYSSRGRASHEGAAHGPSGAPAPQPSGPSQRGGIRPPRQQGR